MRVCMNTGAYINGNAVIESLADDSLSLDVNVFSFLYGRRVNVLAVQEQGHRFGVHPHANLMPVAIKQVFHLWVLKDCPDRIFRQAHGVVLHCLVLSIQTDGHLENICTIYLTGFIW